VRGHKVSYTISPMSENASLVIGASGNVGGFIVDHLLARGDRVFALSRSDHQSNEHVTWFTGELTNPEELHLPVFSTIYCMAPVGELAEAMPHLMNEALCRVVAITSTSIVTKRNSEIETERLSMIEYAKAEQRLASACEALSVPWTILRPPLLYLEGKDQNITRLSNIIRKLGFLPIAGSGNGLRQPVHAEDIAIGAIAASKSVSAQNKIYDLPGGETITYREMVGRIFDGMNLPRRILPLPPLVWRAAFRLASSALPNANVAMGTRMSLDFVFDAAPAIRDFGWSPRGFRPVFDPIGKTRIGESGN
jgi:nucleoside-diphosphate-sugar epimerase